MPARASPAHTTSRGVRRTSIQSITALHHFLPSIFHVGRSPSRPGAVPTLTVTFNKTSAHPFFFRARAFTRARLPPLGSIYPTDLVHRQLARRLLATCHSSFDSRSHPHAPPQQRSAPHTPFLLARAPGKLPSSRPHPPVLFYFSLRYNSILFLFWDPPLAGHHGADRTTDGRGAVGPTRSRSSSTSSSGRGSFPSLAQRATPRLRLPALD